MRTNDERFQHSLDLTCAYIHGAFERELEITSRSIGLPATFLTARVAALLHGEENGEFLRPTNHLPSLRQKAPKRAEVGIATLALAGGTPGVELPRKNGAMSTTTRAKISRSAKARWAERKGEPVLKCKQCGEALPPSYGKGPKGFRKWLDRHNARVHGGRITKGVNGRPLVNQAGSKAARSFWAKLTPRQRSMEMQRRRRKAMAKKAQMVPRASSVEVAATA